MEEGKVFEVGGQRYEVTAISYQETDGERHHVSYIVRAFEEVEEERKAQAEQEAAELEAETTQEPQEGEIVSEGDSQETPTDEELSNA